MGDVVLIERPTSEFTIDEDGVAHPEMDTIYQGDGHHHKLERVEKSDDRDDTMTSALRYILKIPIGSCVPKVGDVVTFLQSNIDPDFVNGTSFRVAMRMSTPWPTVQRVLIEQAADRG